MEDVTKRGYLKCAVVATHDGFATTDAYGEFQGFDADFCRALGAAILGKPELVLFISTDRLSRIDSLAAGSADLVARAPHTMNGMGGPGARTVGVLLHDSYGFLVPRSSAIETTTDLVGRRLCASELGGAAQALGEFLRTRTLEADLREFSTLSEPRRMLASGECDAMTALRSDLAGSRLRLPEPQDYRLLDIEFGKAPAGPRVRGGDDPWAKLVRWVLFALIEAEELGITRENVARMRASSTSIRIRELLGVEGKTGQMLGLGPNWAYRVISLVGNYGEIYTRNLGPATPTALPRTRSRLWNQGGMLFSPPALAQ